MRTLILAIVLGVWLLSKGELIHCQPDPAIDRSTNECPNARNFAFSMVLTTAQSVNGIVKYDKERYNLGNHYDGTTGIYTIPSSGVYLFQLSIRGKKGTGENYLDLRHNNEVVGRVVAPELSTSDNFASNSYIFYCNKGSVVTVYASRTMQLSVYPSTHLNSFLGMKLY